MLVKVRYDIIINNKRDGSGIIHDIVSITHKTNIV
jgi:hypothetical protein